MATVIAVLPVENFDTWHAEYESMHAARAAFGDRGHRLFRGVDDANTVVVVFDWDTADNARRYFTSSTLADSVARGGGRTAPTVYYLDD